MATQSEILEEMDKPMRMHPHKFALWLFMVTVVMLFAALTSAYIVRQAEGNWDIFELPRIFYFSTLVIFLSSATMQWSVNSARRDDLPQLRLGISITAVLGAAFLVMQFMGWQALVDINVYFVGNPSGSFLYVLTGLHGVHLVSGVIFLLAMLYAAFTYKVHSKRMVRIEMCATYWHFLDGLWLYLFFFLLFNS
jgi:cytochrome c oxidase subunit 3